MSRVTAKSLCCGCFACVNRCPNHCISMHEDNEGFLYPQIDEVLCTNCGLCNLACPLVSNSIARSSPEVYACKNKNEKIRCESSSGGIFTLLAENVLARAGIVFGAMFNEQFEVVHTYVMDKEGLDKLKGSKYVQSRIDDSFKAVENFLLQNKIVLFSGTPCQAAGLRTFLAKEYDNLLVIDIACHGVPSPKVFRKYIEFLQNGFNTNLVNIFFRNKDHGWKAFSFVADFEKGKYCEPFRHNQYMQGFLKNLFLRPSCHYCKFKEFKNGSDITLGDYWGVDTAHPEFDDDQGVSLVLVNSRKGKVVFSQIASNMEIMRSQLGLAVRGNPCIVESVVSHPNRTEFFSKLDTSNLNQLIESCCKESFTAAIKNKIAHIYQLWLERG